MNSTGRLWHSVRFAYLLATRTARASASRVCIVYVRPAGERPHWPGEEGLGSVAGAFRMTSGFQKCVSPSGSISKAYRWSTDRLRRRRARGCAERGHDCSMEYKGRGLAFTTTTEPRRRTRVGGRQTWLCRGSGTEGYPSLESIGGLVRLVHPSVSQGACGEGAREAWGLPGEYSALAAGIGAQGECDYSTRGPMASVIVSGARVGKAPLKWGKPQGKGEVGRRGTIRSAC